MKGKSLIRIERFDSARFPVGAVSTTAAAI